MLGFYIKSVIVYLIIFWALSKILKSSIKNRTDVNYKNYVKNYNCNGLYYIYCFIPVIRVLIIGLILFISYGPKDVLDKLFKQNKEDKYND